jgi:type IV pilus assembly protein PilC
MPNHRYAWRGNDRQGQTIEGDIHATNKHEAIHQLHQQRIRVTAIHRQFDAPQWLKWRPTPRIHTRDVTRITRQLATLLHAGVPLLQAFDILYRGETAAPIQALIRDLRTQIEAGTALHQALRQHAVFDEVYCNLVAVGELAGMLDTLLKRLAHHREKNEALRATVRSALVYPVAVLGIACAVFILILLFVVPAFQTIFASFGAELPWLTRVVIGLSESVQQHGLIVLLIAVATVWMLKHQLRKHPLWQRQVDRLKLRLPVFGTLLRHTYTAQWTRTLATLFSAGIPLTEALASLQGVTANLLFQAATHAIQSQLIQGISLSNALHSQHDVFPTMVMQMCAIGEESGALDHMLEKTAEHYEQEIDHTVTRLSTLLEPFIMVVLGLLIGGLVMALYLPIFQLGQVI